MKDAVIERLQSAGYTPTDADDWLLDFAIEKARQWVLIGCNLDEIPEGLLPIAIDRAAGEFLLTKKVSGQMEGIDLQAPAKQIKEGDTSVTFAVGEGALTPEQRLDALIAHLMRGDASQFSAFRRFRW